MNRYLIDRQILIFFLCSVVLCNVAIAMPPSSILSSTLSTVPESQAGIKEAVNDDQYNDLINAMKQYDRFPEKVSFKISNSPGTLYTLQMNVTDGVKKYDLWVDGQLLNDTKIKISERNMAVNVKSIYLSEEPTTMDRIGKGVGSAIAQLIAAYAKAHNKAIEGNTSNYMVLHQAFSKLSRTISWSHQGNDNVPENASISDLRGLLHGDKTQFSGLEIKINDPREYICMGVSAPTITTETQFEKKDLGVWITVRLAKDDRISVFVSDSKDGPFRKVPPWVTLPFQVGFTIKSTDLFEGLMNSNLPSVISDTSEDVKEKPEVLPQETDVNRAHLTTQLLLAA